MLDDILSGLLRYLALPPACLFVMILCGSVLRDRQPQIARALMTGAICMLGLLSTPIGARLMLDPLERLSVPLRSPPDTAAQAIVVLSAGRFANAVEYGGRHLPDHVGLARLLYAVRLHRQTGLPILVSGGNRADDGRSKAEDMAQVLTNEFQVPVAWVEGHSENTAENAFYAAQLLKPQGIERVLLVTHAVHMSRAMMAFKQSGLDPVAAPTQYYGGGWPSLGDFIPSPEGLRLSHYAVYELLGLIWYYVKPPILPDTAM